MDIVLGLGEEDTQQFHSVNSTLNRFRFRCKSTRKFLRTHFGQYHHGTAHQLRVIQIVIAETHKKKNQFQEFYHKILLDFPSEFCENLLRF